jgi:hypothetical protein
MRTPLRAERKSLSQRTLWLTQMPFYKDPPPTPRPSNNQGATTAPFRDPLGLFSDGPPHWTVNKGKKYERPCQTLAQGNRQRMAAAKRLHWHGNRNGDTASLNLEAKLLACMPAHPCLSGACPICMRAQQRLLVMASISILPQLHGPFDRQGELPPMTISIVPDFGRVPLAGLGNFDIRKFVEETRTALRFAHIERYVFGLDVSLNHDDGKPEEAYWQLQWWGFFDAPSGLGSRPWRKLLKLWVNTSRVVSRPVRVVLPNSPQAAAAYGFKSNFVRRVSFSKEYPYLDRNNCRDTRDRLLRGDAWVDLMLFLDRIGLEGRLMKGGLRIPYQPLRSRSGPANGGA